MIITIKLFFNSYLSVESAVIIILFPENSVDVKPVNVHPNLTPIVSISFLYFQSDEKKKKFLKIAFISRKENLF